jgi:hypothetical protein
MLTQLELLERVVEIKQSISDLEIIFLVNNHEIDPDADWTAHCVIEADLAYFYADGDVVLTDYDDIMNYFTDILELSEEEAEIKFRQEVKNVIAIKTGAMSVVGVE